MQEFDLIRRYFAPLAGAGGLGLRDDAALISPPAGCELVMTQDALTAGVHFFAEDSAKHIAQKALRVNLSDLAAKGAKPLGYLLSLLMPVDTTEAWVADFAAGLAADQQEFSIALLGGDTSKILGSLTLSLTAIGTVEAGTMLRRSGAKMGDHLYVSGTIGDAALGLQVRQGHLPHHAHLLERYLLPQPRFLNDTSHISAAMDISDGLLQDAGHLASASGVGLVIEAAKLPLSAAAAPYRTSHLETIITGGDDYELLFTLPADALLPVAAFPLTCIGTVIEGSGVTIVDTQQQPLTFTRKGWTHF